jgi:hypothetical protein
MSIVAKKMTFAKHKKLSKILGSDGGKITNPEFSISTDRNEANLPAYIMKKAQELQEIADILECDVSELQMQYNFDISDHEAANHEIDMNNETVTVGGLCEYKDSVWTIDNIDRETDIVSLSQNGKTTQIGLSAVKMASWITVFVARGETTYEEVYTY